MRKKLPKILVTGGAGFIGSEFVRQGVQKGYTIIVLDKLTYAGDQSRLSEVKKDIRFYKADISDVGALKRIVRKEKPKIVVHFAAETHVDRSIHQEVNPFIETNVKGTQNLIDVSRLTKVNKFIHISTDEVYGEIKKGHFYEHFPLEPNNPYAASKAAADHLVKAAANTHKFPAIIVRPSNNYGPWQYPEKLIPVIILKAIKNSKVPIYGQGLNVREWLYVGDTAKAIFHIIKRGRIGEIYNLGSNQEKRNIDTVREILKLLNKPKSLIRFVKDRPGHDFRYSLNFSKLKKLGWKPSVPFRKGLDSTVQWNLDNIDWIESKLKFLKKYWNKVYVNN